MIRKNIQILKVEIAKSPASESNWKTLACSSAILKFEQEELQNGVLGLTDWSVQLELESGKSNDALAIIQVNIRDIYVRLLLAENYPGMSIKKITGRMLVSNRTMDITDTVLLMGTGAPTPAS